MTERDFDKLFNDKFNNYEGADFSASEWPDMQSRLNNGDRLKKIGGWLLPFLLLLLLFSNGFTWYQYNKLSNKLSEKDKMENNPTPSTMHTITDTVIKRTVVYQYDTIYKKTIIHERLIHPTESSSIKKSIKLEENNTHLSSSTDAATIALNNQNISNNSNPSISKISEKNQKNTIISSNINIDSSSHTPSVNDSLSKNNTVKPTENTHKSDKVINIDSLQALENKPKIDDKIDEKKTENTTPIIKNKVQTPPTFLGLNIAKVASIPNDNQELGGLQIGLRAEIKANKRLSLFTEINYATNNIESENENALPNQVKIPEPSPSFTFDNWDISKFSTFNYIAGIQYHFKEFGELKPYLSLGINGTTYMPYEVEFEYVNQQNNSEQYIKKEYNQTSSHLNYLYASSGVKWNVFSKWHLGAELFTSLPIQKNTFGIQQWGIKFGAFYRINKL